MMTFRYTLAWMMYAVAIASLAWAGQNQEGAPYVGSEGFERLKQLAGQWEGTMDMDEGPRKIKASYKVTSGGSAIVETVFEGAPHEMVTVYSESPGGQFGLTHYCMLHNQPKMVLKRQDENSLTFDLAGDANIDVASEWHMHSVTITMINKDRLTQLWTEYKDGKEGKSVEIAYKRVK